MHFNIFSKLAAIVPESLGFFGYMWTRIGSWFSSGWTVIMNLIYSILKWFLSLIDFMQYFVQKLIGINYWLEPGHKSISGATDNDLLFKFLYNDAVQRVFRAMLGLFIVFLIIFTVFAIVKQEWKYATGTEKDNTKTTIIRNSLKAIALVIITPLILIIGIVSSNAVLASIIKALNIDMNSSFANNIFYASSVTANRYRAYEDSEIRMPVSTDVTFYIDQATGKRIVYDDSYPGDEYTITYADYKEYLEIIESAGVKKYTVDSAFKIPDFYEDFYGYCIEMVFNGKSKYYLVKIEDKNDREEIDGMYYYLKNILQVRIMSRGDDIGNPDILDDLGSKINTATSSTPCFINGYDLMKSHDELTVAGYNTYEYASIFYSTTEYENTLKSSKTTLQQFGFINDTQVNVFYNHYDFGKYFDGGQFGAVSLNAEYAVMADIVDFMCKTGANLYVLDITSPLLNWDYEGHSINNAYISNSRARYSTAGGSKYLPFVVDYSDNVMPHEQGKVLYMAKDGPENELLGSKFILCWKVGNEFVPMIHREIFKDPVTQTTYCFSSEHLASSYSGVVLAKGSFDISWSSSDIFAGNPSYLKSGASIKDGETALEFSSEEYYYNIKKESALSQELYTSQNKVDAVLNSVTFNNSNFSNSELEFEKDDGKRHLFKFNNIATNDYVEFSEAMIAALSVDLKVGGQQIIANYANVNDGKNYLFVSSAGNLVVVQKVDAETLTVKGVSETGTISTNNIVPVANGKSGDDSNIAAAEFKYGAEVNYGGSRVYGKGLSGDELEFLPSKLIKQSTLNNQYVFAHEDKYEVAINGKKENIAFKFLLKESSLYNFIDEKIVLSAPGDEYNLQMYLIEFYDYMTGSVSGNIYSYENGAIKTSAKVISTSTFGIGDGEFEWSDNSTELSVFNGGNFVAKLIKEKGVAFSQDDLTEKTIALILNGEVDRKYNLKTQNSFTSADAMKDKYDVIQKSMVVGSYKDRVVTTGTPFVFNFAFNEKFKFKWAIFQPSIEKECLTHKERGIFTLSEGIQFDYYFEDTDILMFYDVTKLTIPLIIFACVLMLKTLGNALWGVIKRFYEITLYYLAMPVAASTMPLDGGSKFQSVQSKLIQLVLGTYGIMIGLNLFFILLVPVERMSNIFTQAEIDSSTSYFLRNLPFGAGVLNTYVYILFMLVAFTLIDSMPTLINTLVGGDDVVSKGVKTKGEVGKTITETADTMSGKKLLDFGAKAIDTAGKLPGISLIKSGLGKARDAVGFGIEKYSYGKNKALNEINNGESNGGNQQSSRASDDEETQETPRVAGDGETQETPRTAGDTETQLENSQSGGAGAPTQTPEEDAQEEFVKDTAFEAFSQMTGDQQDAARADVMKEQAVGGNTEMADAIVGSVLGINNGESIQLGETGKDNLTEEDVINLIRQILGEKAAGLSDEEIKQSYGIELSKDAVTGAMKGSIYTKTEDGSIDDVSELGDDDLSVINSKIVENANNDQLKEAYDQMSDEQKEEIDTSAASVGPVITFGSDAKASQDAYDIIEEIKNIVPDLVERAMLERMKTEKAVDEDGNVKLDANGKEMSKYDEFIEQLKNNPNYANENFDDQETVLRLLKNELGTAATELDYKTIVKGKRNYYANGRNSENIYEAMGNIFEGEVDEGLNKEMTAAYLMEKWKHEKVKDKNGKEITRYQQFLNEQFSNLSSVERAQMKDSEVFRFLNNYTIKDGAFRKEFESTMKKGVSSSDEYFETAVDIASKNGKKTKEELESLKIKDYARENEDYTKLIGEQLIKSGKYDASVLANMGYSLINDAVEGDIIVDSNGNKITGTALNQAYIAMIDNTDNNELLRAEEEIKNGHVIKHKSELQIMQERMSQEGAGAEFARAAKVAMATGDINDELLEKQAFLDRISKGLMSTDDVVKIAQVQLNGVVGDKNNGSFKDQLSTENALALARRVLKDENITEDALKGINFRAVKDKNGNYSYELSRLSEDGRLEVGRLDDAETNLVNMYIAQSHAQSKGITELYQEISEAEVLRVKHNAGLMRDAIKVGTGEDVMPNENAYRLVDKVKDNEDFNNELILEKMMKDAESYKAFLASVNLAEDSDKADILEAIATMKLDEVQRDNEARKIYETLLVGGVDNDYFAVAKRKFENGDYASITSWDLLTEEEQDVKVAEHKRSKHLLTEEEQQVELEMNMEAVRESEKTDKEAYDRAILEQFVKNVEIEDKDLILNEILLQINGLQNKGSKEYSAALAELGKLDLKDLDDDKIDERTRVIAYQKWKLLNKDNPNATLTAEALRDIINGKTNQVLLEANGLKDQNSQSYKDAMAAISKFNLDELGAKSTEDALLAYQKWMILNADNKDAKLTEEGLKDLIGKRDSAEDDAYFAQYIEQQMFKKLSATEALIASDALMKGSKLKTPKLTTDQQEALIAGVAKGEGDGKTFIALQTNDEGAAYDAVIAEAKKRQNAVDIMEQQSQNINASAINAANAAVQGKYDDESIKIKKDYVELLNQINLMRIKVGKSSVSEVTDEDIYDLIHDENNVGFDPVELVKMRENVAKLNSGKPMTEIADTSKMSEEERNKFNYLKLIVEKQIRDEGAQSQTLINLYENSEFMGKDEIEKMISDFLAKNSGATREDAINELLHQRTNEENNKAVKDLQMQGVSKEEAEAIVAAENRNRNNYRDTLLAIGATDVTKALDEENLFEKQKDAILNDITLKTELLKANIDINDEAAVKSYISDPKNKKFADRLNSKVKALIDPNKQVTEEERQNFFNTENITEEANDVKGVSIYDIISKKGSYAKKMVKKPPEYAKEYDQWNGIIDKDIQAVKKGLGAYAKLSKDERLAKIKELERLTIKDVLPEDYYDWDLEKQKAYDEEQKDLKRKALSTRFSAISKSQAKNEKRKVKPTDLAKTEAVSKIPVLTLFVSGKKKEEVKTKHKQDLQRAESNIDRYNSTAPMRNKKKDFGADFEKFAKGYIDDVEFDKIKKQLEKEGIQATDNSDKAIQRREELFAEMLNDNYIKASKRVAQDNKVNPGIFLREKGVNAGQVRYKDGTSKIKVRSTLGKKDAKIVDKYHRELREKGTVSDKTRGRYERSNSGKRSAAAALRAQNDAKNLEKLIDQVSDFNKNFRGKDENGNAISYSDAFKKKFGDDIYKKYKFGKLENKPIAVQKQAINKALLEMSKKCEARLKYASSIIPAASVEGFKYKFEQLSNKKTKVKVEHERNVAENYNDVIKEFRKNRDSINDIKRDFLSKINPEIRAEVEKSLKKIKFDSKSLDEQKMILENILSKKFEYYKHSVTKNTFTPTDISKFMELTSQKGKRRKTKMSPVIARSLDAANAEYYNNLIKNVRRAEDRVRAEEENYKKLTKTLKELQAGVQNNATKKQTELVMKALKNSQIKLSNLKGFLETEQVKKRTFERTVAERRIKEATSKDTPQYVSSGQVVQKYKFPYKKADGSQGYVKPGTPEAKEVEKIVQDFMSKNKTQFDHMIKSLLGEESIKFKKDLKLMYDKLSADFGHDYQSLRDAQKRIKEELKTLINKNDTKSLNYKQKLEQFDQRIEMSINDMIAEFEKMGVTIKK